MSDNPAPQISVAPLITWPIVFVGVIVLDLLVKTHRRRAWWSVFWVLTGVGTLAASASILTAMTLS